MRWTEYINPDEVRRAISIVQEPDAVFECRILGASKKQQISGYFRDADTMLQAFDTVDLRGQNVYVTIGKLKEECFSRAQSERLMKNVNSTADNDVIGYRWFFIDLDPKRMTGVSSTKEELEDACSLARKVYEYLHGLGFEEPVKALSGNGCHLLYRISIMNDKEGRDLVERCLKTLSALFDTESVQVDTTNFNPSRICKLHGTVAQKGRSTPERPHRLSRIFSVPDEIRITGKAFLQKLVAELPEEPKEQLPQYQRVSGPPKFDLVDFMQRHGMTYTQASSDRATIYRLDECPFDQSHRNGDAKIFLYPNGAIAFKCHHNSCSQYKWQDVRLKFEPTAYDSQRADDRIDLGWHQHNRNHTSGEVPYTERSPADDSEIFRTAKQIYDDNEPEYEYIQSGISVIDTKLHGLQKSAVSVISGNRGSGKSTLVGQIIIQAIDAGQNVVCYSGELNNKKYLKWLIRQAAGKNHVRMTARGAYIEEGVEKKIVEWMGEHFRLYNNKYGNKFSEIEKYLRTKLQEYKADLCVIDNLMALDLSNYDKDKYDAQTAFVWALKNLAELSNTHIIFVAHPKKVNGFIRLNDISGSGNIGNIVDNAFLVHRNNRDFKKGYKEMFEHTPEMDGITDATNVIEVAKDREYGTQDEFISLYFEESTKRLKNSNTEFVTYGWEDDFKPVLPEEIPF